jgi:hypothetical protein
MHTPEQRSRALLDARREMPDTQWQRSFTNALVGILSVHTDPDTWARALEDATRYTNDWREASALYEAARTTRASHVPAAG